MTFGAIMTWILWRVRPALWLDGVVARLIGWASAQLRAIKLRTMLEDADPLGYADLQPPPSAAAIRRRRHPAGGGDGGCVLLRGRHSSPAHSRPAFPTNVRNLAARPADHISENARSCPKRKSASPAR